MFANMFKFTCVVVATLYNRVDVREKLEIGVKKDTHIYGDLIVWARFGYQGNQYRRRIGSFCDNT